MRIEYLTRTNYWRYDELFISQRLIKNMIVETDNCSIKIIIPQKLNHPKNRFCLYRYSMNGMNNQNIVGFVCLWIIPSAIGLAAVLWVGHPNNPKDIRYNPFPSPFICHNVCRWDERQICCVLSYYTMVTSARDAPTSGPPARAGLSPSLEQLSSPIAEGKDSNVPVYPYSTCKRRQQQKTDLVQICNSTCTISAKRDMVNVVAVAVGRLAYSSAALFKVVWLVSQYRACQVTSPNWTDRQTGNLSGLAQH